MSLPPLPDGVTPAMFITCTALAVVLTGIAKAGFGGGIGIVAVPLTIAVLDPRDGLGFMLPILICGDVFSTFHHRGNQSRQHLGWLVAGGAVGIVLATAALALLQYAPHLVLADASRQHADQVINRTLNLTVGLVCLLMVSAQAYRLAGGYFPHFPGGPTAGYGVGGFSGFVSTLAHSAGPLINIYLLERRLPKGPQTATSVYFFLIINLAKVPSYLLILHYINARTLLASLLFMPLIPVGTRLGYWMHKRVAERPFMVIMYLGAAAGAGWMMYKGLK